VIAGANIAVQARDWSTRRIVRELKPLLAKTCVDLSHLLAATDS